MIELLSDQTRADKIHQYYIRMKQFLTKFNLFSSPTPLTGDVEYEIKIQVISTRIYLVLLIVPLVILGIYTSQISVTNTVIVSSPSYNNYSILYQQYPQSLSCPCTIVSIRYEQFMKIEVARYHQVCDSVYITPTWSFVIRDVLRLRRLFNADFRVTGGFFFEALGSLCVATRQLIDDELLRFHAQHLITSKVISLVLFQNELQSGMTSFVTSTERLFLRSMLLLRETVQSNKFMSGLSTNTIYKLRYRSNDSFDLLPLYRTYSYNLTSECSCYKTAACTSPAIIYSELALGPPSEIMEITGLKVGCFLSEALLQSTLVCFYNDSCIDAFRSYIYSPRLPSTPTLNLTLESQFQPISTISDIAAQLMVEKWSNITAHEAYFAQCKPKTCSYSYIAKNSWLVALTRIIGVFSGLSTVLRFVVPRLVRLASFCLKNRVRPFENQ